LFLGMSTPHPWVLRKDIARKLFDPTSRAVVVPPPPSAVVLVSPSVDGTKTPAT
jgi:hypothetical protein